MEQIHIEIQFRDIIFGSGTKVTIFYFHFSPCDTSYVMSMCHIIT